MSELEVQAILNEGPESRTRRAGRMAWNVGLPGLTMVGLVVAWWLVGDYVFKWEPFVVPSPAEVWTELDTKRDLLPDHFVVTLVETLQGFGLAIAVGMPIAILIAYSRYLAATIYPTLVALNAIPKIAIAPILVIWMGFGPGPKIVMVLLVCFFPIVISTATGLKSTPPEFVELARSLSASPLQQFVRVRFPAALPYIFVGLKVAISLAVIGAVVGEFVGATEGLGYVIIASGETANTSLAFAAIVLLSLMSVVLFYALVLIEKLAVPWADYDKQQ